MNFRDLLKPLLIYKKYLLARKLLKCAAKQRAVNIFIDNTPTHNVHYIPYPVSGFYNENPQYDPERILESIDILEQNGHVIVYRNDDIFRVRFECTILGERANNDDRYKVEAIKKSWKIIAAILAAISALTIPILKLVK